jgi:hypothetical protein
VNPVSLPFGLGLAACVLAASPALSPVEPVDAAPAVAAAGPTGTLELGSEPSGATVLLGTRLLGLTPLRVQVAPGIYDVVLRREGFEEQSFRVEVSAGGRVRETRTLRPSAAPSASLPPSSRGSEPEGSAPAPPLVVAILATAVAGLVLVAWQRLRGKPIAAAPAAPAAAIPAASEPITDRPALTPPASSPLPPLDPPRAEAGDARTAGEAAGERFGEYTLREPLGKGGMATVYAAERGAELVALKRPHLAFLDDDEFRERFLREAEIGCTLHHPNIVRILERGHVETVPYFTMELLTGQTLRACLKERGALPAREACRLATQVAEALDYAHLKGVVHRDLKPSNVMVLPDGSVRVMDYGIARAQRFEGITATGAFMGTPDYVAPETAEGNVTDARSDLYSLGVIFYEMLTGRKPFVADTPFATLRMHVSAAPDPPSTVVPGTPPELEAIVLRLLAKDPAQRYPGAEELLGDLRAYLNRAA